MARTATTGTRTDALYGRLRADILGGRLVPGERLKFPDLCEQYGTSVGAAREALIRLLGEGLVQAQAHQGYHVTPLSQTDLTDLTEARAEFESLALQLAIRHGDVAWESALVAAHHALGRTPMLEQDGTGRASDEWTVRHAAFHLALLVGCPNRRVLRVAGALREEAELYRQWSVSRGSAGGRDAAGEHLALLGAALDRDADRATGLVREHIAHTARLLVDPAGGAGT